MKEELRERCLKFAGKIFLLAENKKAINAKVFFDLLKMEAASFFISDMSEIKNACSRCLNLLDFLRYRGYINGLLHAALKADIADILTYF